MKWFPVGAVTVPVEASSHRLLLDLEIGTDLVLSNMTIMIKSENVICDAFTRYGMLNIFVLKYCVSPGWL